MKTRWIVILCLSVAGLALVLGFVRWRFRVEEARVEAEFDAMWKRGIELSIIQGRAAGMAQAAKDQDEYIRQLRETQEEVKRQTAAMRAKWAKEGEEWNRKAEEESAARLNGEYYRNAFRTGIDRSEWGSEKTEP